MTEDDAAPTPTYEEASRFLLQASFGPIEPEIAAVRRLGLEGWFFRQVALPRRVMIDRLLTLGEPKRPDIYPLFWEGAIHGPDQLRQRVAYALSRIIVVSLADANPWFEAFAVYADHLAEQAFGNYGDLLRAVTYSPAMGMFLSHLGNEKADPATGAVPDENYARELMQLFTIGTVPLSPGGEPRPGQTYTNADVEGLAAIMTGLDWAGQDRFGGPRPREGDPRRLMPMDAYPVGHEAGAKRFLGYEAEGENPIEAIDGALAHLMKHPNTAPFVTIRLIQAMVTSNPEPAYVRRAAKAFEEGRYALPSGRVVGEGARGDMAATVAAILFDEAARSPRRLTDPRFGRVREPTMRLAHVIRAFREPFDWTAPIQRLGYVSYSHLQAGFAEQPWYAPSVFGSFSADYRVAGSEAAAAGMVAPEMQAMNTASAVGWVGRAGAVTRYDFKGAMAADFAPLYAAAERGPEAVTDLMDRAFYHGAMPPDGRARMLGALARLEGRDPDHMKQLALTWVMTDPAFAVQR